MVLLNWYVQESRYRSSKRNILAKRYLGRYVPSGEDCFADLLKAAKYAPNPYYLQGKVISQVLSKPWPVVSAIIHPQSFLANFVLLSSNLQGLTLSRFFLGFPISICSPARGGKIQLFGGKILAKMMLE